MSKKGKERIYEIWANMKYRCNNKNCVNFKNYGGRGIRVCEEWNAFENFYKWAIDNEYSDNLTLDRIDVNGNYEPENCRWATWEEQANNRRRNSRITYNGETHTISEWARIKNLSPRLICERLYRLRLECEQNA